MMNWSSSGIYGLCGGGISEICSGRVSRLRCGKGGGVGGSWQSCTLRLS